MMNPVYGSTIFREVAIVFERNPEHRGRMTWDWTHRVTYGYDRIPGYLQYALNEVGRN